MGRRSLLVFCSLASNYLSFPIENQMSLISSASAFTSETVTGPGSQPINLTDVAGSFIQEGGFILPSASFSFTQRDQYSTWDLNFTSWPSAAPIGNWYYYCPDEDCDTMGWVQLRDSFLLNSWIQMNSVKFVAFNAGGQTVNATATIGGYEGQVQLSVSVLTQGSALPTSTVPLPYSQSVGSGKCSSQDLKVSLLTSSGGQQLKLPFDNYVKNSPVRPLCMKVTATATTATMIGDITVTAATPTTTISANAWLSLDSSLQYPSGFTPIRFTGGSSKEGTVYNAIKFDTDKPFTFTSPQVNLDYVYGISQADDVGALVYSTKNATWWYLPASRWNYNSANRYRITMSLDSSGILIFGYLNNTANSILPANLGQSSTYLSTWPAKTFEYSGSSTPLRIHVSGSTSDCLLKVTDYTTKVIASAGYSVLAAYAVSYNEDPSVTLLYPNSTNSDGYIWAYYKSGESTGVGFGWTSLSTNVTTFDGYISAAVDQAGIYGLVRQSSVVSAATSTMRFSSSWIQTMIVVLSTAIFLL